MSTTVPDPPFQTPLLTGPSIQNALGGALAFLRQPIDTGLLTDPWMQWLRALYASLQTQLVEWWIVPEQFGATYGPDDTGPLQAAINASGSTGKPLIIYQPIIASALTIPSGATILGWGPEAVIQQKPMSAVNNTPFITNATRGGGGDKNIIISGITIDANAANQGAATGVDAVYLNNFNNVRFVSCTFKNAIQCLIRATKGSYISVQESCQFTNWGTGNVGAIYWHGDAGNFSDPAPGTITGARISQSYFDGWTSSSSCIKLEGDATHPITDIDIEGNWVYPGYNGSSGTLGIEIYAPSTFNCQGFLRFSVRSNYVVGNNNAATMSSGIFGISLGGSGGSYGSVWGNHVYSCGILTVETIASHVRVMFNDGYLSGPITIDAGSTSLQDIEIAHNSIVETAVNNLGSVQSIHAIVHTTVGGPWNLMDLDIHDNYCQVTTGTAVLDHIVVENQTAGNMLRVRVAGNRLVGRGSGATGGTGIGFGPNVGTSDQMTVEGNLLDSLFQGIIPAGTNGRYLWNRFMTVGTQWPSSFDPTDMIVEIDNTTGDYFTLQSLLIRGMPRPTLVSSGDIHNPNETAAYLMGSVDFTKPNVVAFNDPNFSSELQGGIIAVNSRWNGFPNWIQSSTNAYARALFLALGAGRFGVSFGSAANASGATPGTQYFWVDDPSSSTSTPGPNAKDWLRFNQTTTGLYYFAGNPNGSVTGNVGSICMDSTGNLWFKQTGSGNTGWVVVTTGSVTLPSARSFAYGSGGQAIGNAAFTALMFDTNLYDNGPVHSTSSNPTRFTAPVTGYYMVAGQVYFAAGTSPDPTQIAIKVRLNGATDYGETQDYTASTNASAGVQTSFSMKLNASDYIEFMVYQASGGSWTTNSGVSFTFGTVIQIQ